MQPEGELKDGDHIWADCPGSGDVSPEFGLLENLDNWRGRAAACTGGCRQRMLQT
jgi:hypothetical protein